MPEIKINQNNELMLSEGQFITKVSIDNLFTIKEFKVTNENNIINYHVIFSDNSVLDAKLNNNDGKWKYSGKALSQTFRDDPDIKGGIILTVIGAMKKD